MRGGGGVSEREREWEGGREGKGERGTVRIEDERETTWHVYIIKHALHVHACMNMQTHIAHEPYQFIQCTCVFSYPLISSLVRAANFPT